MTWPAGARTNNRLSITTAVRISRSRNLMKLSSLLLAAVLAAGSARAAELQITALDRAQNLTWSNALPTGVLTVESAVAPTGPWRSGQNFYTTTSGSNTTLALAPGSQFVRLRAADISATEAGFSNLVTAYGILETIAGAGQNGIDGVNGWQTEFEGGPAINANLSRPHFAMADDAGNIFIADKDSHSILKVTPDGNIHTAAGTHLAGANGDGPATATTLQLNAPNGVWVRGDGTFYVLDTGNGKVRRVDASGVMTTLFTVNSGIKTGRGLWVSADESLVYFCSGTSLRKRTPAGGVQTLNNTFSELGNLVVEPAGTLVVTDRGASKVFRVTPEGVATLLAGNGQTFGGGDGAQALDTGLAGVRGVWLLPNGGYLLATHAGSQIWYVDAAGVIRLFLDGLPGNVHAGDGDYFRAPGYKIGEARSVSVDRAGNILITENDYGYVRRIRFERLAP